ncbi:iron donor protein CyaY [Bryobacter aggregatus]|uniref:iron donor protein CyaY n=1 Tax=Bryobacter aggregatus TaxID=360054 RepID=UPI0004E12713|nr:iron donor protein CyaY [Bryobacter aggregatus]
MTDSEFQLRCDTAMTDLNKALLRAAEAHEFDPDFQAGALTVEFEEPREKYVVSPQAPAFQVWVSARVKSYKLDWEDARQAFVLPATGQTLKELMADLLQQRIGEPIAL